MPGPRKAIPPESQELLTAFNEATTAVGVRIEKLLAQNRAGMSAEDVTKFNDAMRAEVARLKAMGTDPNDPIPVPPPTP